jgi:hypothetical protein
MGEGPYPAPVFDALISEQTMRGLANAENATLDPEIIGGVDPDDIGLLQVNTKDFKEGYRSAFLDDPPAEMSPTHLLKNPYINTRISHAILWKKFDELAGEENEDGTFEKFPVKDPQTGKERIVERKGLWRANGFGDFKTIPLEEQETMVQLAYKEGATGLVRFLKHDSQFDPKFPTKSLTQLASHPDPDIAHKALVLANRTETFKQGKHLPIDETFQDYLSARQQRKEQVLTKYLLHPDPLVLEQKMKEAGFPVNPDPATVRPAPTINAETDFKDNRFTLPGPADPLRKEESGLLGQIGSGIGDAFNTFVQPALNTVLQTGGIPPQDQIGLVDLLNTPVDLSLGVAAGKGFPERGTGQEVNQNLFGIQPSEEILAEKQELANTLPAPNTIDELLQQGQVLGDLAEKAAVSQRAGDITRSVFEVSPIAGSLVKIGVSGSLKKSSKAIPEHGTATGPAQVIDEPDRVSDLVLKDIDKGQDADAVLENAMDLDAFPGPEQLAKAQDAQFGISAEIKPLPEQATTGQLREGLSKPAKSATGLRYRRGLFDAFDTMKKLGPSSEVMANAMQETMARYENMITGLAQRQRDIFKGVWGKKALAPIRGIHKGASTTKFFKMSQKESDALVEYLSRGGDVKTPDIKSLLTGPRFKMTEAQYEKIQRTGNALFTDVTGPVSAHPILQTLEITDPVTGLKRKAGSPSMFFPQVPITDVRKNLTKGGKFEMLFNVAKAKDPTLNREVFRAQLRDRISAYRMADLDIAKPPTPGGAPGEQIADKFRVRTFAGVEQARLFNPAEVADANGISIAQVYRDLGYDDDPIRAITSYTIGGLKRGETGRIYETIRGALPQAAKEIEMNPVTAKHADTNIRFVDRALSHFAGHAGGEVLDTEMRGIIANVLGFQSATLLQAAFISNMAQLSIVGTQATIPSVAKALGSTLNVFRRGDHAADLAATNYITMAQEWQKPGSLMGRIAQDSLRTSSFTMSEKFLRSAAGRVGFYHVLNIAKNIQKTPRIGAARHKLKWDGMAIEMGYDPNQLRQVLAKNNGVLPIKEIHRGVEVFTNRTAGRTDMRGLPLWAAEHKPTLKTLLQFKNFGLTNLNTLSKVIVDAPTPMIGMERALKALGMGTMAGVVVQGMRDAIIKQVWPTDRDGVLTKLDTDTASTLASSLTVGLGNVYGMLIASAASGKDGVTDFFIGPTGAMVVGGIDTAARIAKDETDFDEFKTTALRRIPYIPALGPALAHDSRQDRKKKQKREKNRGKGFGSFGDFGDFGGIEGF